MAMLNLLILASSAISALVGVAAYGLGRWVCKELDRHAD